MRSWARASTVGCIVLALSATGCGPSAVGDGPSPATAVSTPSGSPEGPGPHGSTGPSEQPSLEPGVRVIEATIEGSEVVTSSRRVDVALGENVQLVITADVDDEVHVHGYDLKVPITRGKTTTLEFVADIPGVFEVELERAGLEIVELKVQ